MPDTQLRRSLPLLISALILSAAWSGFLTDLSAEDGGDRALIRRDRIALNLAGAEAVLSAAKIKADEMKLKVNIAIVDDGGHLLTFARLDGARPASAPTAITKAVTAATMRQATGPLRKPGSEPGKNDGEADVLLNLSLQNAAAQGGGKITTLYGGVPIVVQGQVIGAVGVGGATGEQDAEIARAGIEALLRALP